jgi:pimeloyl-ACP methyl ester carboxylesterase
MVNWTAARLDAGDIGKARLIGHSMGSLIALETLHGTGHRFLRSA